MSPRPKQETSRQRKRVEVRFGLDKPQHIGYSGNLSTAGLMVRTTKVFPPGTVLAMELKLSEGIYALEGMVIWARSGDVQWLQSGRIGMGVMFVNPPEELLDALRARGVPASRGA